MDYEKKYKEALERAKRWADGTLMPPDNLPKTVAEVIFPELAESEDERVRKWLIRTIRLIGVDKDICADQETMDKAIAWLEKQKELFVSMNPAPGFDSGSVSVYHESENEGIRKWIIEELEITRDAMSGKNDYSDDPDIVARLKRLDEAIFYLEKQKEQKPSWSEEDEKMKEGLITRLNWITYNTRTNGTSPNITFFDEIEWLKSLPLNLKKKNEDVAKLCSNEWSEEDRRTIDHACVALRAYANGELPDILPSEILEYADKLQSLHPSWKPSKEQMSMLLAVIRDPNNAGSESCFLALQSLYEDLKRL